MKYTAEHYTYRVHWSPEDDSYVGTVAEFPSLSWVDQKQLVAFNGIQDLVSQVLQDMASNRESIPSPISEKKYSGKFLVRIPPEQHRKLAIEAAEQNISLNRLASSKLIGA